jgi:hypothetical protein
MGFEDFPFASAPVLNEALKIALGYLKAVWQGKIDDETERLVAGAILSAWLAGTKHRIRLANVGIVTAEQARALLKQTVNPGLSSLRERFFDR